MFYLLFTRQVGWKAPQMVQLCWCLLFVVISDLFLVLRAPHSAMSRSSWRTCWGQWTEPWFPWDGTPSSLWVNSTPLSHLPRPACNRIVIPGDPKQSKPLLSLCVCVCSGSCKALPGKFCCGWHRGREGGKKKKKKKASKISVSRWLARIDICVHQNDVVLVIRQLRSVGMRFGCCYCITSIYLSFWLKLSCPK